MRATGGTQPWKSSLIIAKPLLWDPKKMSACVPSIVTHQMCLQLGGVPWLKALILCLLRCLSVSS